MAVSGSTDFALTANDAIQVARDLLGVRAEEEPLSQVELERGLTFLNMMLKSWEADGVMAWTKTEGTITLAQGDVDYVVGSGGSFTTVPLDIEDMRITRSSIDLPMFRLSRPDYYAIPNKTVQGYPTQWYYDRQRDGGTVYVWPAPDSTAGTLKFTYRRRIMDMDASGNNFDLPQEWYLAITHGLAVMLGPIYGKTGTPRYEDIKAKAAAAYDSVKSFDQSEGEASIFVLPAQYPRPR